jgi:hypothetical protein
MIYNDRQEIHEGIGMSYNQWRKLAVADFLAAFNKFTHMRYIVWPGPEHHGMPIAVKRTSVKENGEGEMIFEGANGQEFEVIIRERKVANTSSQAA